MMDAIKRLWHRLVFNYHYYRSVEDMNDAMTRERRELASRI